MGLIMKQPKKQKCTNPDLAHYWTNELKEVPSDNMALQQSSLPLSQRPVKVWCSNTMMVMLYNTFHPNTTVLRLTIRLHEHKNGILDWDALMQIKDATGFSGYQAFEVYPDKADIVNAKNLRHLWIMPPDTKIDIGWIRRYENVNVIEPFTVQKELSIAQEQLDVFIKGGQWSSVAKHGYPKDERKKYVVLYHFPKETNHNMFIVRYSSLSGFAVPVGAIVTHYHSVLELPEELTVKPKQSKNA